MSLNKCYEVIPSSDPCHVMAKTTDFLLSANERHDGLKKILDRFLFQPTKSASDRSPHTAVIKMAISCHDVSNEVLKPPESRERQTAFSKMRYRVPDLR